MLSNHIWKRHIFRLKENTIQSMEIIENASVETLMTDILTVMRTMQHWVVENALQIDDIIE